MPGVRARISRWWIVLPLLVLGLVGIYALVGFYAVPHLVRAQLQAQVDQIGRKLSVGQIRFNPFTLEASIAGLSLREADDAPLLAFESLYVNASLWDSLRERGAVLQAVRWVAPDLSLVVEADGSVNLSKLVLPSSEPKPEEPGSIAHLRIGELSVQGGRISIEDRSRPQPFSLALSPIAFGLHDFQTDAGHANQYAFSAKATTGESLDWSGDFTVQPIGSKGRFALGGVQASTLQDYLQDQLPLRLLSGVADTAGEYQLTLDPTLSLDVKLPAVNLHDWSVAERESRDNKSPLSVAQVALQDVALSLARREVSLRAVEIRGLRANVQREADGSLNLARLAAPAPPAAGTPKPKPSSRKAVAAAPAESPSASSAPWRVSVAGIHLRDAKVDAEDRSIKPAVRVAITPISVDVDGFSTDLSAPLRLAADLGVGAGGRLRVQGPLRLSPLSTQLKLDLQNLDLTPLQSYLAQRTGLALNSARLGVRGDLDLQQPPGAAMRLGFKGAAQLGQLQIQDRALKQDLVRWKTLTLAGIDFQQGPDRLNIASVDLLEPYAKVVVTAERELNLSRALAAPDAAASAADASGTAGAGEGKTAAQAPATAKPASTATMPIRVQRFRIERGQLAFADLSIDPQFAAGIVDLNGSVAGISSDPASRAKIDLHGRVDEFAPVSITGDISPFAPDRYTDVALSFRNMDLIRFNPYSGRFAGYNIVKGKLTTELKYNIQNRALQAEHHVVVDQLEFGDATGSKDAVPLPVKLAVALLKDRHGVIDLALPVSGSLDDPSFRVGPLVWKVLVNLLTKAVTAPFAALGSLFGGGDELSYVAFAPGSAAVSAEEADKLGTLAKALVERPALKLDIPYAIDEPTDGPALARVALEQQLAGTERVGAQAPTPEQAQAQRLNALQALYVQQFGQKPNEPPPAAGDAADPRTAQIAVLEQALLQKLAPDTAALERLAAERAHSVQARLLASPDIAPERLFLTSRRAAKLGEHGHVRMELNLQ